MPYLGEDFNVRQLMLRAVHPQVLELPYNTREEDLRGLPDEPLSRSAKKLRLRKKQRARSVSSAQVRFRSGPPRVSRGVVGSVARADASSDRCKPVSRLRAYSLLAGVAMRIADSPE